MLCRHSTVSRGSDNLSKRFMYDITDTIDSFYLCFIILIDKQISLCIHHIKSIQKSSKRICTYIREYAGYRQRLAFAVFHILNDDSADHHAIIQDFFRHMLLDDFDTLIFLYLLLNMCFGTEYIAADHNRNFACELSQIQCFFQRGIAAADHTDILVTEKGTVADRAVRNTASDIFRLARDIQHAFLRSAGNDQRFAHIFSPVRTDHSFLIILCLDSRNFSISVFSAETSRMRKHFIRQVRTVNAFDSRPVAYFIGLDELSSRYVP